MIPTLLVVGLAIGLLPRLPWRLTALAVAVAAVAWPALLVATGAIGALTSASILGALALAAANAAVGAYLGRKLATFARAWR